MGGYVPGEQPQEAGYIKLNTNENPYPPSPRVIDAIREALGAQLRLYPDPMATALRRAAARRYGLAPEQVLVGNGSDELLALVLRACVDPGDGVAFPWPTYSLYDTLVTIEQGRVEKYPFEDSGALPRELWRCTARVIFLCHPNSPTGVGMPREEIADLLERQANSLIVVDEAYVDFADWTAVEFLGRYPNLLVLRTFSKSFSLAGMRLGLAFASAETIAELVKVKDSYNVDRLALVAGVAALEDYAWMEQNVTKIRATRQRLTEGLRELGFVVPESQANFVWARQPGHDMGRLYDALKAQRILVRYFPVAGLRDGLRITVGTDDEADALFAALHRLRSI